MKYSSGFELDPRRASGDNETSISETGESPMPYAATADLPDPVRSHLPAHAQEIYLAAFNNAWEEYARREDREALTHRVAWAAVKQQYRKAGKDWVKK